MVLLQVALWYRNNFDQISLLTLQQGSIIARGVYHPLLLEPSLDPLKDPPATEPPPSFEPGSNSASSNTVTADSFGRASWEAAPPEKRTYGNKGKRGDARPKRPCPIDLLVRPGAKLIAVTGPNTGGPCSHQTSVNYVAYCSTSQTLPYKRSYWEQG